MIELIFAGMEDGVSVGEASERLQTSAQTVRNLIRENELQASRGIGNQWRVDERSIDTFLERYGPLAGGRRRKSPSRIAWREVERLRRELRDQRASGAVSGGAEDIVRERDDLRRRLVLAEDSLAGIRDATELQRAADTERGAVVEHLLSAVAAAERADSYRRNAIAQLEDVLARTHIPHTPGA